MKIVNYLIVTFIVTAMSCGSDNGGDGSDDDIIPVDDGVEINRIAVDYIEDDNDFPNPDRGFYRYSETRASNYQTLDKDLLVRYRIPQTTSGSNYQSLSSLVFRYFVLDDFANGPISQEFLDNMQTDFDVTREAGAKLIPRFTYSISAISGDCNEGFICPPYGDAPKSIVLSQIEQLGEVLSNNSDVISTIQMGFIGTWGENYYTDFFGDPSSNESQGRLLDDNWQDRIDVLEALLNATPKDIMIQVRYPQMKQRYIYGINSPTNSAALTTAEGFSESDKARIGFHNDCLLASEDDFGTYEDYGNSSSTRRTDVENLKEYFKEDSKYVIVGGETCYDGYSPQNNCDPVGIADIDLRNLHYTYLNANYNNEVNNDWTDGGCIEDIKRNLGYRFVLNEATYPIEINLNETLDIDIKLENVGYASPVKERNVQLVLENVNDGSTSFIDINTDVRDWHDTVDLSEELSLGSSIIAGQYNLFLLIEEPYESLKGRSEYAIRLANEDVWDESTGYNNLGHTLIIK